MQGSYRSNANLTPWDLSQTGEQDVSWGTGIVQASDIKSSLKEELKQNTQGILQTKIINEKKLTKEEHFSCWSL